MVETTPEGEKERTYEERILDAGKTVAIDETADLKFQLEERALSDTSYDVWIQCIAKEAIDDGQTMWRFKVYVKAMGPKAERVPF